MTSKATGTVRNLHRSEQNIHSWFQSSGQRGQVLAFRVEHTDEHGDVKGYTQVEMRGETLHGDLTEGDRVEIRARRSRDGIVRAKRIRNLSTRSDIWVSNRLWLKLLQLAVGIVILVLAIGWIVIVASFLMNMMR